MKTKGRYLIKGGRLVDPGQGLDEKIDILVSGGLVEKIAKDMKMADAIEIDAAGMIVAPGLVDMHTHLREPGREDKETILSGTRAALKGGYTTLVSMPNTEPAIDDRSKAALLKEIIKKDARTNVEICAAITKGRDGQELVDMEALKDEGVKAVSDDGSSVEDPKVMRCALTEAAKLGLLLIAHSEDHALSYKGVINSGFVATKTGLRGIPAKSEYERIDRDIKLAEETKSRIHIAHVSCKESVEIIRRAKKSGIRVTAETAPHYLALTDECCVTYDPNTKMNPPLRTAEDIAALKAGLRDGTIDVIATDHAPHTDAEKDVEFEFAPFGIIGLETALGIAIAELIDKNILGWPGLIEKLSLAPARIIGIERGTLKEGMAADIVIIDPEKKWTYSKDTIESKSKNSPFINWVFKGKAVSVLVAGEPAL